MDFFDNKDDLGKHNCQLRRTSGSTLPRLPPNAKILSRLKRKFQKLIMVSEQHPYVNYYLRSQAAISFEKRRHQSSRHWWIIHPCSRLRFAWDNLMVIVFLYFFIIVPYVKIFYIICGRKIVYQFNLLIPVYTICMIDIVMNFITGYTMMDGSGIILDPSLIARHYTQTYFLIDLITSVPYGLSTALSTATVLGREVNFIALIAELIPLLKIIRLTTLRHHIKQLHTAYGITGVKDVIIWLSLLSALILHWSACVTWGYPFLVIHAVRVEFKDADAYVMKNKIYYQESWQIYMMSLHMGISNLVGSCFIEFTDISQSDKTIRCILLLFGTCYMVYLIVVILQLVESSAEPELKYQEIMRRVKEYIREKNLPPHLGKKLISYYEYRFQGSYFKENIIVATLPNHLKQEINIRSNRGLLRTATVFYNLPGGLLTDIMSVVKPIIYLKDDVIFKFGEPGNSMFFISSGTIAIMNLMGKEIAHLEDGNHFGEICIVQRDRYRTVTAIAVETTELLRLDQRYFNRLIIPNSILFQRFLTIIKERMQQVKRVNEMSMAEERLKKRRSSEYKRLLMRTGDLDPLSFMPDQENRSRRNDSSKNTRGSV